MISNNIFHWPSTAQDTGLISGWDGLPHEGTARLKVQDRWLSLLRSSVLTLGTSLTLMGFSFLMCKIKMTHLTSSLRLDGVKIKNYFQRS